MNDKRADNRININKEKIKNIDNRIDIEKDKLKKLDNIQDEFVSLNKSLNRCVELLSESIKGKKSNYMFEDMTNNNNNILKNVHSILDEEKTNTEKNLINLYSTKDQLEKENKKQKEE